MPFFQSVFKKIFLEIHVFYLWIFVRGSFFSSLITGAVLRPVKVKTAGLVSDGELSEDYIIPAAFDKRVGPAVAAAVAEAARRTGAARI